jgi:precorrin-6Y C5,15-methyltransferase (decarboxylating)
MASSQPSVTIIGIGDDGLDAATDAVRKLIHEAGLLAGSERVLAMVDAKASTAERLVLGGNLDDAVDRVAAVAASQPVAVLVSGDPLFYGLARFLCDRIGRDRCEILPHVSSMQLAFARVKESWDEAYLTNLANHQLSTVVERIRTATKVGLFTTAECGPHQVAQALLDRGIDYFTVYVCENLGSRDECVTLGRLQEIAAQHFGPLNVMILVRDADVPDRPRDARERSLFGNPDELFLQSTPKQGLLTGAEVRAIALAQLALDSRSIVWDVGAGSGSVSVEAARLAPDGHVYAIEQDEEDAELIGENQRRFGVTNVTTVIGRAPEVWRDLPDPDAVFVEGSGREIARLAELAFDRLRSGGRLVANVVSVEGLHEVRQALAAKTDALQVTMVNVARGTDQLNRLRFDALNPNFLVAATR